MQNTKSEYTSHILGFIRVCDFQSTRKGRRVRDRWGSFPFFAPEMAQAGSYDPFPADIWSMGMLLLEVVCSCGIALKVVLLKKTT